MGPEAAVSHAFRHERPVVLAGLIRHVGDFQLAEDAVQDAFVSAVATWPRDGVPDNPRAWLSTAARRRAIDRLRRDRSIADRAARLADLTRLDAAGEPPVNVNAPHLDDRLRLIFTCCHPALDPSARTALTLRVVGGLSTAEIARAFLVAEPTMGKRISRAKNKIRDAHIPYRVPAESELPGRLRSVLRVVYLIFNEGYSATVVTDADDDRLTRTELTAEAIRLGCLLCELMPDDAEVWGLLALMLLHEARRPARLDDSGRYVSLTDQDPDQWDRRLIADGTAALDQAARLRRVGPYQVQAAITALHLDGTQTGETDWHRIADLYAALRTLSPSPVIDLNHVAAVGFADGPDAGLRLLAPVLDNPALEAYQPLHATHADLLRRAGDLPAATRAYQRAIALSSNPVERAELHRRLQQLLKEMAAAGMSDPQPVPRLPGEAAR